MILNVSCKNKIASFATMLETVDAEQIPCSAYARRYLQHLLSHKQYYLAIYAHVLDNAIQKSTKNINYLTMLDFGAGNGLLAMFAKHCGFKKVLLCDINAAFVQASKLLAQKININVDDFIEGDITQVSQSPLASSIDVIAATDVIEHIYNLDDFFAAIKNMNGDMVTVFTTASNPDNYFKVQALKRMQIKDETIGGDPADFVLAGEEKHAAYLDIRKELITQYFTELAGNEQKIELFAKATRGLRHKDIITKVQAFLNDEEQPLINKSDTNTCHPITGSWTERILSINDYRKIYQQHGFGLELKNGFYNSFEPGFKNGIKIFMNFLIKILGKKTAPFITLIGFPQV